MNIKEFYTEEDIRRILKEYSEKKFGGIVEDVTVDIKKEWRGQGPMEHEVNIASVTITKRCEEGE